MSNKEVLVSTISENQNTLTYKNVILCGDALTWVQKMPDNFINLIVTSPPYADNRKNTYGGIKTSEYVGWMIPISKELLRVLKPEGTFILNIKEKVENGERSTYVIELILALKKQGWLWTEEFVWHKKNSFPGKWNNRFRDSWERCLQFNKNRKFDMYQEEVMVPIGDWYKSRMKNLSETDMRRDNAKNNSGFGKKIANWIGKEKVYPSNVLHLATECSNKKHSAAFPEELPTWFIKLFSTENDIVLDPFCGSGTSCVAAKKLNRSYIGIDLVPEYCELTQTNLEKVTEEKLGGILYENK